MVKKILVYGGLILVIVLLVLFRLSKKENRVTRAREQRVIPVEAMIVKPSVFKENIQVSGSLLAAKEIEIHPEASGRVVEVNFREGQQVKAGDLLLRLNDKELRASRQKLLAQQKLARDNEARKKQLRSIDAISQEEYDMAATNLEVLDAELNLVNAQLEKMEIRAPFDGQVGLTDVFPGSYLTPATRVTSLFRVDKLRLDFSIPERFSKRVNIGDLVYFTVEGSKEEHQARVYAIDPAIDSQTRSLQVRALADNGLSVIYPGNFARVRVDLASIPDAILVPTEAIIPVLKGQTVYLYQGGKVISVPVELGARDDANVHVISGIQPGDTLVTRGVIQLRPGTHVVLTKLSGDHE